MEFSRQNCRLCLSLTDFKISIFGSFCQNINIREKILACLKIVVDESDNLTAICYKCVENIERHYDFIVNIKRCQEKMHNSATFDRHNIKGEVALRRHITSYIQEQVIDDYTFSFLDVSKNEEFKDVKASSPAFSYFSPKNSLYQSCEKKWKAPTRLHDLRKSEKTEPYNIFRMEKPKQNSCDMFESQSQDVDETDLRSLDWKITPNDTILKKVREKCFGRLEF